VEMRSRLRDTLIRLIGLAWGDRVTPPLTFSYLENLLKLSRQRIYEHLAELRTTYSALRLQKVGTGTFVIWFEDWLFDTADSPPSDCPARIKNVQNQETHDHDDEEEIDRTILSPPHPDSDDSLNASGNPEILSENPDRNPEDLSGNPENDEGSNAPHLAKPNPKHKAMQRKPPNLPTKGEDDPPGAKLPEELRQRLLQAGVFPRLLDEVAASGYFPDELAALLSWVEEQHPSSPAPLFMGRLRSGALAPRRFFKPHCRVCGQYGEHAPNCRKGYISGEFADFVEH
jgi:hypothetical protein